MNRLASYFEELKIKKRWKIGHEEHGKLLFQPFLIGNLERFFFTTMIALDRTTVAGYVVPWVGLKMLTGWNRLKRGEIPYRMLAFNALIGNIISPLIAFLGGLIILKWGCIKCYILRICLF